MAITNALLVRWASGFTWVTDAASITSYGRREGYVTIGGATSPDVVGRVALAVLAKRVAPEVSVTAALEPAGGDVPYVNFGVGDTVTAPNETGAAAPVRIVAMGVAEDAEGHPTFVPELGAVAVPRQRDRDRWLKSMLNGSLGGTVAAASPSGASASPSATSARETTGDAPPFNINGAVVVAESVDWWPRRSVRMHRIFFALKTAGTSTTTVVAKKNGAVVATFGLASGVTSDAVDVSVVLLGPEVDKLAFAVTVAGAGAIGLEVQPVIT